MKTSESQKVPKLGNVSEDTIIDCLTMPEKAALLSGTYKPEFDSPDERGGKSAFWRQLPDAASQTQGISRLGIPSVQLIDGPAGVRCKPFETDGGLFYATAFPVAVLLASSWDDALVEEVGACIGGEAAELGIDLLLAPALNLQRNPLGGRNFEYFSEDPLLSGKMAAAFVRGVQSRGVGATVKHFAVNNQETDRFTIDAVLDEKTLRELYLTGFEIALSEASPWCVMSAYNRLNGVYCAACEALLTGVLRHEWGWDGAVMTDWGQMARMVQAVRAQNDLMMPHGDIWDVICLERRGLLAGETVDRSVRNVLKLIARTPAFKRYKASGYTDAGLTQPIRIKNKEARTNLSRSAAAQGMILLKNNNHALPAEGTAALFGQNQVEPVKGGTGSGDVYVKETVSLQAGLRNAGLHLLPEVSDRYKAGGPEPVFTDTEMDGFAAAADRAIFCIGRGCGEESDRALEKGDYYLTDAELLLFRSVCRAFHALAKPVAVILNICGMIDLEELRHDADALLLCWAPGETCGDAIADVATGKVNPSGKLPHTVARRYHDHPSAASFPGGGLRTVYEEGMFAGYRYFTSFQKPVAYEFGYGLSYTSFSYHGLRMDGGAEDDTMTVSVDITNTGAAAGREAAQLYVRAPRGPDTPERELRGYAKTALLEPGETETVRIPLKRKSLRRFSAGDAAWIVEEGEYEICVGASCLDIRQRTAVYVTGAVLQPCTPSLFPPSAAFRPLRLPAER